MRCFLKDVDDKQEQNEQERVRNWVTEIRDLAYEAEDVIDSFILKVASSKGEGFHGIIKKFWSIFTKPSNLHKIGNEIKSIQTKLEDIRNSLPTYGIKLENEASTSIQPQLRRSYPHFEEEGFVGLVDATKEVMGKLLAEEDEEKLHFVSIVGMGGIGKTTLAKKVYNCFDVKRTFDFSAWAFISQQCSIKDVLRKLLADADGKNREVVDRLQEEDLFERLYNFLRDKRYLVVLDDIWKNEDWDKIKQAFPKGKKGSKILFTTRNREVALHADPRSSLIETRLLTSDEGWELLKRKAVPRSLWNSKECLQQFKELGREMVKHYCGGLPLAIVVLGGLLATKESLEEWEKVSKSIKASMRKFQEEDHRYYTVNGILALSYNELPYHLKPCFLYLSHYPEDWEISTKKLIRLWIAEGFISPSVLEVEGEELLMEDVAEEYLEKLISRCLVQVERQDHTGKHVKTCRIHDLLRDFCLLKARDEKFMGIIPSAKNENEDCIFRLTTTSSGKLRRIAGHLDQGRPRFDGSLGKRYVSMFVCDDLEKQCSKLHSILLCQDELVVKLAFPNAFKLLRVLNLVRKNPDFWYSLQYARKWRVPTEIGNLIHLRYLALEWFIVILPRSIGNLNSLQTLYVRAPGLKVPNVLFKLKSLRHLSVGKCLDSVQIDILENIITLKGIAAKSLIKKNMVLKLTKIQSLAIEFEKSEEVEVILKSNIFYGLRSLRMVIGKSISDPELGPLSNCHQLSKLRIDGEIPEGLHSVSRQNVFEFLPTNILTLDLIGSQLKHDPMSSLEKLPQLRTLYLRGRSYMGSKMVCSANGFPQLNHLDLENLSELEEWEIQEDAMPRLKTLCLLHIPKLRMVPEGLKHVKTLQKLELWFMKSSFVKRIQVIDGREGEDFFKMRHIPSITVMHTKD
ncbi:Disease resistance protein [Corchorus olitorius]|uniref:Disease resistance protein n=1 Tax=Corchorus olitorius TaxID=93759 RepID=A0A1R3IM87_9ROSI|nr:Disease resistance protein [Corchorus olitorius]